MGDFVHALARRSRLHASARPKGEQGATYQRNVSGDSVVSLQAARCSVYHLDPAQKTRGRNGQGLAIFG